MKTPRILFMAAVLFCITALPQTLAAQQGAGTKSNADLGSFVTEILKVEILGDVTQLAMWMPFDFYVEASLTDTRQPRDVIEQDMGFLKPYITMIIQSSIVQDDGSSMYAGESEVRKRAVLLAPDGSKIRPVDDPPPMVAATVAAMKTILASEGDAGGANMHVLIFPNKDKKGEPVIDTHKKSKLTLVLNADGPYEKAVFTWHTPFDAMVNAPPCAKCGEEVSATWTFCAWCGAPLPK